MSSIEVWYAVPSAAPAEGASACLGAWLDMGYRLAVARECDDALESMVHLHLQPPSYQGYQRTTNLLAVTVLCRPEAKIVVGGGDDVWPDPNRRANEIAEEFIDHFGGTLGIMQPIGDSSWSPKAHRIAWSPWLGREWCLRAYGGRGPFPPMYWHYRADIELAQVAQRLRLWWARPDIVQRHARHKPSSPHLAHLPAHLASDARAYNERLAKGFPGSGLAPA